MTREEAIRELSYIADEMPSMECGDWKEAIHMAVKALEQEPCEDAISRSQALSDYADWFGYGYRDNTFYKHLQNMPSVQPKPSVSILDNIRAEIEQIELLAVYTRGDIKSMALEIIDKYKESEDKL